MENNHTTMTEMFSLGLINDEKQLLKRSLYAYASQLKANDASPDEYRFRNCIA